MFGTLRPHKCALSANADREHWQFYCGLCKSLGHHYGNMTRALLSYDAVFLALFADGFLAEGAPDDSCRCPIAPWQMRNTVAPKSVAMRYAAAMQMLLGDQWLADRAIEGKKLAAFGRNLIASQVRTARKILSELGVPLDSLENFEQRQANIEVIGVTGPACAALPTAEALGIVLQKISFLPGVEPSLATRYRSALHSLGQSLGRVIYLSDALEDLEKDRRNGDFNPCLEYAADGSLQISPKNIEICRDFLRRDMDNIREIFQQLPWQRHREVLENILCNRLPLMMRKSLNSVKDWLCAPEGDAQDFRFACHNASSRPPSVGKKREEPGDDKVVKKWKRLTALCGFLTSLIGFIGAIAKECQGARKEADLACKATTRCEIDNACRQIGACLTSSGAACSELLNRCGAECQSGCSEFCQSAFRCECLEACSKIKNCCPPECKDCAECGDQCRKICSDCGDTCQNCCSTCGNCNDICDKSCGDSCKDCGKNCENCCKFDCGNCNLCKNCESPDCKGCGCGDCKGCDGCKGCGNCDCNGCDCGGC